MKLYVQTTIERPIVIINSIVFYKRWTKSEIHLPAEYAHSQTASNASRTTDSPSAI